MSIPFSKNAKGQRITLGLAPALLSLLNGISDSRSTYAGHHVNETKQVLYWQRARHTRALITDSEFYASQLVECIELTSHQIDGLFALEFDRAAIQR